MTRSRFPRFVWSLLAYNLAVILWGAYVRATGAGAGCGNHWPLCDGVMVPRPHSIELIVEYSHRVSSGITVLLTAVMLIWAFRAYPKRHIVRLGATLTGSFTLSEALVGAALVKLRLVAHDESVYRAIAMSVHLCNTFMLLACTSLTARWAEGLPTPRLRGQGAIGWALGAALLVAVVLGVSGALAALGDTLFPATSVMQGIQAELSPSAHLFQRMRLPHPLIAMSAGLYLILIAGLVAHLRPSDEVARHGRLLAGLFMGQILLGCVNVLLLAPVAMQLAHLLMAECVWIALVLLAGSALAVGVPQIELGPVHDEPELAAGQRAGVRDYIALTKPRVISLLLFTTLAAMVIAKGRWPGTWLFLAVALGGYMAAGAANVINMVIDRDIDGRMKRTSKRPTVTQLISSRRALLFGFGLEAGSFTLLWSAANLLTAMLALAGLVFYVIVYTLVLKRRTWHNIVIGGAAGAFPPLVGWAAVTNDLGVLAWILFAIIFVWTPVHFWALALLLKDDYASAGVPMLPVVLGERVTVIQIGLYSILTAVISVAPMIQRQAGPLYFWAAMLLNAILLVRTAQLYQQPCRPRASKLFHYSMLYLALLFLVMAVDRTMHF